MDIPDSPMEMQREWIRSQLDDLPEGSSVTIPVEQYRNMVLRSLELSDLVARQQKLLEDYVPDY
tara:strand:+ start:346 stop:537 length:192 start_codon:yes stop_codon:yes gene_type:complete